MKNQYSQTWFELFLKDYNRETTQKEISFITHFLKDTSSSILDVACGYGRHAIPLSKMGHKVTGVDNNPEVIHLLNTEHPECDFTNLDMRNLKSLRKRFDAILLLWQSWGYHSEDINKQILSDIREILKPEGIFIIDIYNKDFFVRNLGSREFEKGEEKILETKSMKDGRLDVRLEYQKSKTSDHFNWQIFNPEEFRALVNELDFQIIGSYTRFDLTKEPSLNDPRMEFVLSTEDY